MLNIIRELLLKIVENIDSGNSNLTETDSLEVIEIIKNYTDKTQRLSKYQACQKLNVSRATFDNLVRKGIIPRGKKIAGYKELFWIEKELKKVIEERQKHK